MSSGCSATPAPETTLGGYDITGEALERRLPPGRRLHRWVAG